MRIDTYEQVLYREDEHITTQESANIIKITSFIRPYIPSSETYHLLPCQLKFILMANQVLRSIGYEGQVAKFIPIVRPTTLHALLIDTTTLYALFCSSKLSKQIFFNIDKLKSVASSYGSKTVRLYGSIGHFKSSRRNLETKSKLSPMKAQKKELDKSLRDRTNELYQFLQDNDSVRGLKKAWKTNFEEQKQCYEKVEDAQERDKTSDLTKTWKVKVEEKDERYRNVEAVKLRKRELMVAIRDTKERLHPSLWVAMDAVER
ncbi:hypothetical protein BD408DRAFT_420561 [Parasitella parasitica]|nr:hypothetical protein BD408DRAFT_420561 [Parasitella parasitica]